MTRIFYLVLAILLAGCSADTGSPKTASDMNYPDIPVSYPTTATTEVTDDYHGTAVADPYRWLEDDNAENTKAWVGEQNKVTFGYLEQIPFRKAIEDRLTELVNYPRLSSPFKVGDYYFFSKNDGLQNQSVIYYQQGLDGEPKVFIDPNALNEDGTTSISLLGASKDKKYMAYSRSDAGSDWRKIYVREIATNTDLEDELEWVKFSGAGWYKDGFFYSRYPAPAPGEELKGNNQFHSVYYHKLGTGQDEDQLVFRNDDNPGYYHYGGTTEEEDYFIMYEAPGTDGFATYYATLDGNAIPQKKDFVALFPGTENKSSIVHTEGDEFWVRTDIEAPNYRLVKLDINKPSSDNWVDILPNSENLLQSVSTGGGQFFANYLEKATDRYYRMNAD
ncbi:MAG: S9 family peptidase, partial [Bacteroidota bacterium]